MTNYNDQTPEARFEALNHMAQKFFGSARWKTDFCRRYDLTPQTLTAWTNKGAPVWAVQAMADALKAKRLTEAVALIQEATMGDDYH